MTGEAVFFAILFAVIGVPLTIGVWLSIKRQRQFDVMPQRKAYGRPID